MKKEIFQEIEIPEGIEAKLEEGSLIIKGPEGENKRNFNLRNIIFEIKDKKIRIGNKKATKKDKKRINTISAHIKNMIKGVTDGFTYTMKVVYSHFPIQLKIEKNYLNIGNFLGEKKPRKARILGDTSVEIKGNEVVVSGINIEEVGQTTANIQQATKIRKFDPRIFQDGIYVVEKIKT